MTAGTPNVGVPRCHLAVRLGDLGRYKDAHDLAADTLARSRRILGADHPDTLRSVRNLADDLRTLGRDEEADRLEGEVPT